jgi:hypothetical protein
MIYLVIGFIGGVTCAFIASNKRRSAIGWFVIGFLLPLIGVILAIVLPSGANDLEVDAMLAAPSPGPRPAAFPDASIEALERLAALRDRGALTAEEFETKKQELLAVRPTAMPSMVTCPNCARQVDQAMTTVTGNGVLCDRCYESAA